MCGPETPSNTPRVGARVDFYPAPGLTRTGLPLSNLLFLNPSSPSSRHATHVRFHHSPPSSSSSPSCSTNNENDESVLVSIHETGDLTKPLSSCGLLRQFTLHSSHGHIHGQEGVEVPLGVAVALDVGQGGIIGRRVSMRRGEELLGDGIVGFNFN